MLVKYWKYTCPGGATAYLGGATAYLVGGATAYLGGATAYLVGGWSDSDNRASLSSSDTEAWMANWNWAWQKHKLVNSKWLAS